MTENKTDLLVRLWRVGHGIIGPSAEFRLDPSPGRPKTIEELLGAMVLVPRQSEATTIPWEAIRSRVGHVHAVPIEQRDYNEILAATPEGGTRIGDDEWLSVSASLRLRPDGLGLRPSGFRPGPGLVVSLTRDEYARGMDQAKGRFIDSELLSATSPGVGRINSVDEDLLRAIDEGMVYGSDSDEQYQP